LSSRTGQNLTSRLLWSEGRGRLPFCCSLIPAMVFVLDNYDSFTYNLVQYIGELGAEVEVRRNDQVSVAEVAAMKPERIVVSPGPCTPQEAGISIKLIKYFTGKVPVLGVCLGHQAIGEAFGGEVVRVIVTHLGLSPAERRFQVRKLLTALSEQRTGTVIVLSDFNEWLPTGRSLRWIHTHLGKTALVRTFPARFPIFALDRIWVSPPASLRQLCCVRTPLSRLASDHLPLKATIDTTGNEITEKVNSPVR